MTEDDITYGRLDDLWIGRADDVHSERFPDFFQCRAFIGPFSIYLNLGNPYAMLRQGIMIGHTNVFRVEWVGPDSSIGLRRYVATRAESLPIEEVPSVVDILSTNRFYQDGLSTDYNLDLLVAFLNRATGCAKARCGRI